MNIYGMKCRYFEKWKKFLDPLLKLVYLKLLAVDPNLEKNEAFEGRKLGFYSLGVFLLELARYYQYSPKAFASS